MVRHTPYGLKCGGAEIKEPRDTEVSDESVGDAELEAELDQLGGRTRRSMAALVCTAAARVGRVIARSASAASAPARDGSHRAPRRCAASRATQAVSSKLRPARAVEAENLHRLGQAVL